MRIENWWSLVDPSTRQWLIDNNGGALPPWIVERITAVAGPVTSHTSWVGARELQGLFLSDAASDWLEAAANDEVPEVS